MTGAVSPGASAPAIAVEHLTVRYGDVLAVDDASIEIGAGRVCGLPACGAASELLLF